MKSEIPVPHEHDDDLGSVVDARNDVETDDYPKTNDDFENEEPENDESEDDDRDDDS